MADRQPIIVIKRVSGHGGHHGGAWKVAYADFVTAMMALFIVLWLLNSSKEIKEAVGGYFKDPTGTSKLVGNGQTGSGENILVNKDNMDQLKDALQDAVRKTANFEKLKNHIEMTITSEGLRIELMESEAGTFFGSGAAVPTEGAKDVLTSLAAELGKLPNRVSIEGHTDAKPFAAGGGYGNWELSADRANAARRLMEQSGLQAGQVTQVRGFADRNLRKSAAPEDASNRRVSVIVQYQVNSPGEWAGDAKARADAEKAKAAEDAKAAGSGQKAAPAAPGKH
jgi:chemotaxis protein MotB